MEPFALGSLAKKTHGGGGGIAASRHPKSHWRPPPVDSKYVYSDSKFGPAVRNAGSRQLVFGGAVSSRQ
jgi:hypothetical protein